MSRATRRTFLAGLGSIGVAGLDTSAARATTGVDAGTERTFSDPDRLEATVDDLLADRIGTETAGATVAVVEGDDIVLATGYGTADASTGEPVRAAETGFRIGSVSKLLTFTAVMQGVERGVLDLDTDVNTYLADSPVEVPATHDDPVTLRHLGTHTAGFEAIANPGMVDRAGDVDSLATTLAEASPGRVRPPGEVVAYSNYGSALAGHVVAEAHGTTFEAYARSELFEPLGMDHSTFAQPVADYPGSVASPHTPTEDGFAVADAPYITWRPAGSVTATATDMAAFMSAHLGDGATGNARLLASETTREMHRKQFERHPAVNDVRYGFWERGRPDESLLGHSGSTIHFTSRLLLAPDEDVGIFLAYNTRGAGTPAPVVESLAAEYDLGFDAFDTDDATRSGAQARAERVAGEYRPAARYDSGLGELLLSRLRQLRVQPEGDGRIVLEDLQERRPFVEVEPYVYHEVDGHDAVAFDVADDGVVRAHLSGAPEVSFVPTSVGERQLVAGATAGAALGGFALSTLGWTGLAAWRRWRGRGDEPASEAAVAHAPDDSPSDAAVTIGESSDATARHDDTAAQTGGSE